MLADPGPPGLRMHHPCRPRGSLKHSELRGHLSEGAYKETQLSPAFSGQGQPWQRHGDFRGGREAACLSWDPSAFRWQNKAGFAGPTPRLSTSPSSASPPAQCLGPHRPPPHLPGRRTGLHRPSRPAPALPGRLALSPAAQFLSPAQRGAGRGARSCGESAVQTCRFILRTHNAAFTHRPAFRNWAGRCLVMPAGLQVNASDLAYIISRALTAFPVFPTQSVFGPEAS